MCIVFIAVKANIMCYVYLNSEWANEVSEWLIVMLNYTHLQYISLSSAMCVCVRVCWRKNECIEHLIKLFFDASSRSIVIFVHFHFCTSSIKFFFDKKKIIALNFKMHLPLARIKIAKKYFDAVIYGKMTINLWTISVFSHQFCPICLLDPPKKSQISGTFPFLDHSNDSPKKKKYSKMLDIFRYNKAINRNSLSFSSTKCNANTAACCIRRNCFNHHFHHGDDIWNS